MICEMFSLKMLGSVKRSVFERVSLDKARKLAVGRDAAVWNPETARLFTRLLGVSVAYSLQRVALTEDTDLLVGQLGSEEETGEITWWHIYPAKE